MATRRKCTTDGTHSAFRVPRAAAAGTVSALISAAVVVATATPALAAGAVVAGRLPNGASGSVVTHTHYSAVQVVGFSALVVLTLALAWVAITTLWWMLHAWRTPEALLKTRYPAAKSEPQLSFSLIVPARHEAAVLGDTLDRLAAIDHPAFEVLAVIGHDDPETADVANAAAQRHPGRVRVLIDSNVPKNKPKALNTALVECRGDITGVFDAEDEVHPALLRNIEARLLQTRAHVVQGGVQLMNFDTSWWAVRNVLEYYFWFRSRLHFHAERRFIPLGGNTVFIRTDLLRSVGGWDVNCLAEDCEIGVRLSAAGARIAVAYEPQTVTREETPDSLDALLRQRARWDQGFLQVLRKGEWRRLPTSRQRMLAWYTLAMPFLQAFTALMIPISIALMIWAKVPTVIAMLTFVPVVPTLITLAVEVAALDEFGRAYHIKVHARDYARLVIGAFPYQLLLGVAALRAVWREAKGERGWEKTQHSGLHRGALAEAAGRSTLAASTERRAA